jgi:hypothetical protein
MSALVRIAAWGAIVGIGLWLESAVARESEHQLGDRVPVTWIA